MICPKCSASSKIRSTTQDPRGNGVYRSRVCNMCDYEFRTFEFYGSPEIYKRLERLAAAMDNMSAEMNRVFPAA